MPARISPTSDRSRSSRHLDDPEDEQDAAETHEFFE